MEAAGAGFDRHLVKPVDHDMLMRVLAEVAEGGGLTGSNGDGVGAVGPSDPAARGSSMA
jgi:hypothetical protein